MRPYLSRKESIILSAIEVVDKVGISELSLRDIAAREEISEAALYKHFKSKEEILAAVFDYYCRFDSSIMDTVRKSTMSPKDSVIFFFKSLVESYESHPAMTCLVNTYEVLTEDSLLVQKVKDIFSIRLGFIEELVAQGQKEGTISIGMTAEELSAAVAGIERIITLKWRMGNYGFPLKQKVVATIESLLNHF